MRQDLLGKLAVRGAAGLLGLELKRVLWLDSLHSLQDLRKWWAFILSSYTASRLMLFVLWQIWAQMGMSLYCCALHWLIIIVLRNNVT